MTQAAALATPLPGLPVESELAPPRGPHVKWSPEIEELLLQGFMAGFSLHQLSKEEGLPSYGSILWRVRNDPGFRERLDSARAARAYHLEDKALSLAEGEIDKDAAPGTRLRFDIYRWGAETGAPEKFGKKVTVAGDQSRPIVFKVITGVPEPALPMPVSASGPAVAIETTARPVEGPSSPLPGAAELTSALLEELARAGGVEIPGIDAQGNEGETGVE